MIRHNQSQRLSERQEQVIDFICEEITRGQAPSQSDVAREFDLTRQCIAFHVKALERKGWLHRREGAVLVPAERAWNRQLLRAQEQRARANIPRGLLSGGSAKAYVLVRSALQGLGSDSQQLVLDLAVR